MSTASFKMALGGGGGVDPTLAAVEGMSIVWLGTVSLSALQF